MTFRDLKIGTRLGTGFAAILVLMACMLATALWQFAQIARAKDNMVAMSQHAGLAHDWLYGIASNSVRNLAKIRSADAEGEVRNLAQRSADAAKEIRALIQATLTQVDAGGKLVDEAGVTMQQVVAGIARVSDLMTAIAAAGAEQAAGIEQVNAATIQMDNTTQQNASLVEEAAAAAASLKEQAAQLAQLVSSFEVGACLPEQRFPVPAAIRRLELDRVSHTV